MFYLGWSLIHLIVVLSLWSVICIFLQEAMKVLDPECSISRKTRLKVFVVGTVLILFTAVRVGDTSAQHHRVNFNGDRPEVTQEVYVNNRPTANTVKDGYQNTLKSKEENYE